MVELKKESDVEKDVTENESIKEENQNEQKETETTATVSNTSESAPEQKIKLPKNLSFQMTKELKIVMGISLVIIILVGAISYRSGFNKNISTRVYSLSEQYREVADKLEETKTELKENENLLNDLKEYEKNRKELNENLKTKTAELETKNKDLEGINTQISQKQAVLDKLNGDIVQAKGQPITLPAGQFVVGNDVPAGRYNVSGSSNFFVYSSSGRLKVNTILGNGYVGRGDYVCTLDTGDNIENHARTTFTPIQ